MDLNWIGIFFSKVLSKSQDDIWYQSTDMAGNQGNLYSVSQRVPPLSTSYSNLCSDSNFSSSEQSGAYKSLSNDWEKSESSSDTTKEGSTEGDKQTGKVLD